MTSATGSTAGVIGGTRSRTRVVLCIVGVVLLLACVLVLSVLVGNKPISLEQFAAVLRGEGDPYLETVVASRIPRTVIGLIAGAALAVSGSLLQAVTRNPLADPGLLGVNAGAALAIVLGSLWWGSAAAQNLWVALPGAVLAGVAVLILGGNGEGNTVVRLVLAGAVISAVLTAVIQSITIQNPAVFDGYRFWVVGALSGRSLDTAAGLWPIVVLAIVGALLLSRSLSVMALGSDTASALGVNTARVRVGAVLCATVLGAAATAAAGPIAFIGLAVPHISRALVGQRITVSLPVAILLGPIVLIASDIIGRVIARPEELMVGVVTAVVGAPFLLIAVRRMRSTR